MQTVPFDYIRTKIKKNNKKDDKMITELEKQQKIICENLVEKLEFEKEVPQIDVEVNDLFVKFTCSNVFDEELDNLIKYCKSKNLTLVSMQMVYDDGFSSICKDNLDKSLYNYDGSINEFTGFVLFSRI